MLLNDTRRFFRYIKPGALLLGLYYGLHYLSYKAGIVLYACQIPGIDVLLAIAERPQLGTLEWVLGAFGAVVASGVVGAVLSVFHHVLDYRVFIFFRPNYTWAVQEAFRRGYLIDSNWNVREKGPPPFKPDEAWEIFSSVWFARLHSRKEFEKANEMSVDLAHTYHGAGADFWATVVAGLVWAIHTGYSHDSIYRISFWLILCLAVAFILLFRFNFHRLRYLYQGVDYHTFLSQLEEIHHPKISNYQVMIRDGDLESHR
jgi:hypothetical protein